MKKSNSVHERTSLLYNSNVNENPEDIRFATKDEGGKGTLLTSTFNLCNAAVGAGVLAFPKAYENTGLISGLVLTAVSSVFNKMDKIVCTHSRARV